MANEEIMNYLNENPEVKLIPIDEIRPNPWNPNKIDEKVLAKLEARIKSKGFRYPILVRPMKDPDTGEAYFQIVDGEHRWTIMKKLGARVIPSIVKELDDDEAKIETINSNYMRGNPVPIRLANLIHELNRTYTIADLENMLPYEKVELQDSLELLKIPSDIDKVVKERVATEKKLEPVFISATIYKDKEKSLHDFIEQAMLESEATFCEIKIKIECGPESKEEVIRAIQNLKLLETTTADFAAGEEAPIVTRFALFEDQFQIVDQALMHIIRKEGLTKNARGRALELLAADYLAGAEPLDE